jgi:hypothetical protein
MTEKEAAGMSLLFLRSLDGICPDIPLERNKETVLGGLLLYLMCLSHEIKNGKIFLHICS